jgi:nucleotide-binding universal stress UspA family protein
MAEHLTKVGHVVVGTDFSRASERAVERAAHVAREHRAHVTVVHAAPAIPRELLKRLLGRKTTGEKERLAAVVGGLKERGLHASGRHVEDFPVRALVDATRSGKSDLLVVGARGRTTRDEFLGSTAQRVLDAGRSAVLVARGPVRTYRRVVAAIAADATAVTTLIAARAVAPEASLDALHVYESPFEPSLILAGVDAAGLQSHRRAIRGEARESLRKHLANAPVQPEHVHLHHGDPRVQIARRAHAGGYDLVVVLRGRSRAKHWIFGSVTESILREAGVDVLLV